MHRVTENYPPSGERPLAMVLHCPNCGLQHIDAPDPAANWTNPPHRSHLCLNPACATVWRPCDVATTGVAAIATKGKSDTWPATRCDGRWSKCDHAYQTLQAEGVMRGAPIMLCRLTGKHPDDCRPVEAIMDGPHGPEFGQHVAQPDLVRLGLADAEGRN